MGRRRLQEDLPGQRGGGTPCHLLTGARPCLFTPARAIHGKCSLSDLVQAAPSITELTHLCEWSLVAEDRFINETALLSGLLSSHLWKPLSLSLTRGPAAASCLQYQVQVQMSSAELVHHAPFLLY